LGAGWGTDDGPQSGYFPFYIGLLMSALPRLVNLFKALRYAPHHSRLCRKQPAKAWCMAIFHSQRGLCGGDADGWAFMWRLAIFIAVFMRWQGKFSLASFGWHGRRRARGALRDV
jgi:hypothetical protein